MSESLVKHSLSFKDCLKSIYGSIVEKSDILTTSAGQKFQIIINKVIWYAVHIHIEVDPRLETNELFSIDYDRDPLTGELFRSILEKILRYKVSQHWTLAGAQDKVKQLKTNLVSNYPPKLTSDDLGEYATSAVYYYVRDQKDVLVNPDKYFLPGDHVQVERGAYTHAAIYIGNKRVIQVSDPGGAHSKQRALVNEADWSQFHCGESHIYLYCTYLKRFSSKDIVSAAKSKIGQLEGKYNILSQNCQHFATSCQLGEGKLTALEKRIYRVNSSNIC